MTKLKSKFDKLIAKFAEIKKEYDKFSSIDQHKADTKIKNLKSKMA